MIETYNGCGGEQVVRDQDIEAPVEEEATATAFREAGLIERPSWTNQTNCEFTSSIKFYYLDFQRVLEHDVLYLTKYS